MAMIWAKAVPPTSLRTSEANEDDGGDSVMDIGNTLRFWVSYCVRGCV